MDQLVVDQRRFRRFGHPILSLRVILSENRFPLFGITR
jgi:hypothetical protein